MRWLNYQHLFYFWNVARLGSITTASKHLRLAQPTISAQLKSFEQVLGEKLFEREGRSLKLTEHGQIAYRYAEQIFSLGQEFLDLLDGKAPGKLKQIKIGVADVVPKSVAYRLLEPAFGSDWGVTVVCLEDKTERLLADLAIGEVDLVIADRPIPPSVKVKAFNHFIGESGVSFLAAPKLAKKFKKFFPRSLSGAPLLLPTHDSALRGVLEQWFELKGIEFGSVGTFQDRALMKIVARDGRGIMQVPSVVAKEVMEDFKLALVGETKEIKEQFYLISLERRLKNPLVSHICSIGQTALFGK